jgi:hypothetical protein
MLVGCCAWRLAGKANHTVKSPPTCQDGHWHPGALWGLYRALREGQVEVITDSDMKGPHCLEILFLEPDRSGFKFRLYCFLTLLGVSVLSVETHFFFKVELMITSDPQPRPA